MINRLHRLSKIQGRIEVACVTKNTTDPRSRVPITPKRKRGAQMILRLGNGGSCLNLGAGLRELKFAELDVIKPHLIERILKQIL